jgi:hypothetical protein
MSSEDLRTSVPQFPFIPAQAGIQERIALAALGPRLRGDERRIDKPPKTRIAAFLSRLLTATSLAALAAGCSSIERLKTLGEQPALSQINNPTTKTGYKPVQMPMPAPQPASYNPNSLWRTARAPSSGPARASGDILTVKVKITDKATLENDQRSRKEQRGSGVTDFGSKLIKTPASLSARKIRPRLTPPAKARAPSTTEELPPTWPAWSSGCCRTATW